MPARDAFFEEFCDAVQSYCGDTERGDERLDVARRMSELTLEELDLSLLSDLMAIFSGGMAVNRPPKKDGRYRRIIHPGNAGTCKANDAIYVVSGHPAEAFVMKCLVNDEHPNKFNLVRGVLSRACQKAIIRNLILDGMILADLKAKKPQTQARRSN